jgi:Protein of unknown function (DUF3575)
MLAGLVGVSGLGAPSLGAQGAMAPPTAETPAALTPDLLKVGASSLLGIPMLGMERPLRTAKRSFQWDVVLSPWRSVEGYPLEFLVGIAEWRFHRKETRDGLYAAMHVGAAAFRLRRPDYRDTTLYQEGAGVLAGASVGRVWRSRSGRTVEVYLGVGTVQSLYKGYDRATGRRYDGARLWNVSGEWLPYRTGLSVGLPRRRR